MIGKNKMLSFRRITEKYFKTISKFRYKGQKPNKTQVKSKFSVIKFDLMNN